MQRIFGNACGKPRRQHKYLYVERAFIGVNHGAKSYGNSYRYLYLFFNSKLRKRTARMQPGNSIYDSSHSKANRVLAGRYEYSLDYER